MYFTSFASVGAARLFGSLALLVCLCAPRLAFSQTPSPLQEWQYSSGVVLEKLFAPSLPEWRVVAGLAAVDKPLYDGAKPYRAVGGPVVNVQFRDIAFASVGEGLGFNIFRGDNYRAGFSLGYDLGRHVKDDLSHLRGLGNIDSAPVVKVFGTYVISKDFPLVMRADVRHFVGGLDGTVADLNAYLPLPGSSKTLFMFAGPSLTLADHRYLQKEFGVTVAQAFASGYPVYDAHSGATAVGVGFTATHFFTKHWLANMDLAVNRLLGSASDSPITQTTTQHVVALSVSYTW